MRDDSPLCVFHLSTLLQEIVFSKADLPNNDLRDANFRETNLRKADLSGTDLADTDLFEANPSVSESPSTPTEGVQNLINLQMGVLVQTCYGNVNQLGFCFVEVYGRTEPLRGVIL